MKKTDKTDEEAVHKPTILDIINETEKNQTKQQTGRFAAQQEILNQQLAIGHPGVAEPLTWQQLEREMLTDQKIRDSSTSKEGISTWILLSGSDQQTSSASPTPPATTLAAQVDKLEVQTPPVTEATKRTNFRFQEAQQTKIDQIGKIRQAIERRQSKPEKRNKPMATSTVATTTTSSTTESSEPISVVTETKVVQRRKNPSFVQMSKQNKKKTTTTTTTSESPMEEITTIVSYIHGLGNGNQHGLENQNQNEEEVAPTTTPVPFLVLEPKDADFDLPQDRSPGPTTKKPKRPNTNTKPKKKNANKNNANNKKNPSTKVALNKQKDKPFTTKIYNYLSREVMPTVGVGLVGIVVTAGLASYFFGPLGALRRSYDDAMDRQDTGDSIYAVNSEEYASGNSDNGQNEEEVFGKFIAGMPANYMPKYVRNYQPPQGAPVQGYHQGSQQGQQAHPQYQNQRRVHGHQNAGPGGPKYGQQQQQQQQPYFRNRNGADGAFQKVAPSPHYNPLQYNQQQPVLRNHQPQPQQPLASPYIQQLHDMQMQKSLSSNIESALKQHTYGNEPSTAYKTIVEEKSIGSDIVAEEKPAEIVLPSVDNESVGKSDGDIASQIQREISHFVVGSVVPEPKPEVEDSQSVETNPAVSSPEIVTATHGPRRKRSLRKRRQTEGSEQARYLQSRTSVESELKQIDELFKQLQEKIDHLNSNQTDSQKSENDEKIRKEFKQTEDNVALLHQVIDHVKDIEKFQKEFYIKSKNWELAMTLKTGMTHIRNHITLVSDLLDHPDDANLIRRIDLKDNTADSGVTSSTTDVAQPNGGGSTQIHISPLDDLMKLLQLKALFGLNILQNIRPSFERAFEEVFRMPAKEKPN